MHEVVSLQLEVTNSSLQITQARPAHRAVDQSDGRHVFICTHLNLHKLQMKVFVQVLVAIEEVSVSVDR